MPIRDMVSVHDPRMEIYRHAFSTEFKMFTPDELRSVNRAYGHCVLTTLGALYDEDGNLIKMSERDGGRNGDLIAGLDPPRVIARDTLNISKFLPGTSLYLGYFMHPYGHFLVETMARLWGMSARKFDHYVMFPYVPANDRFPVHDFHNILLREFGITMEDVSILRSPTGFEEIYVPESLATINFRANIAMSDIYRDVAKNYHTRTSRTRLFLSRLQPFARLANVTEVENVFRELDFEIIYPEILDFKTQLKLYASCRIMAGLAGSALHNCLFCQEGTAVIELGDIRSRSQPLSTQRLANQVAGADDYFIAFQGSLDGRMDIANLRRVLSELPLLARSGAAARQDSIFHSRGNAHHYAWPATMTVHFAVTGDVVRIGDLAAEGPVGESRPIEGLSIALHDDAPFGIEYRVLLNDNTWTAWSGPGTFLGSRGQSAPIWGFAVRLTGPGAARFRCVSLGKFAGQPGIAEAVDGDDCSARERAHLIALQMLLRRA